MLLMQDKHAWSMWISLYHVCYFSNEFMRTHLPRPTLNFARSHRRAKIQFQCSCRSSEFSEFVCCVVMTCWTVASLQRAEHAQQKCSCAWSTFDDQWHVSNRECVVVANFKFFTTQNSFLFNSHPNDFDFFPFCIRTDLMIHAPL